MVGLVPAGVVLGCAEAEGAAEVDDARSGVEDLRREVHGGLRRGGQENDRKLLIANGLRAEVGAGGSARTAQDLGLLGLAVVQENGGNVGVAYQQTDELRPAIAS